MKVLSLLFMLSFMGMNNLNTVSEVKEMAPEITMENPEGQLVNLSSLQGNIVLVDFWASWCSPCRKSRTGLKNVYHQFKDSEFVKADGFKIYSVSLDKNKKDWVAAIEKYDLSWTTHVSDFKGFKSETVKEYGIKGIPNNVLLNAKGEIIAKNVFASDLSEILVSLQ